jgi:hypothetical protein
MTALRQRFIEDMQLRNLAPTTQRSYLHYTVEFARFYNCSPEKLDLEAVRQYQLHLLHEKKLSPESINTFISSVQFLYLNTLDMPWGLFRVFSGSFPGQSPQCANSTKPKPPTPNFVDTTPFRTALQQAANPGHKNKTCLTGCRQTA